jgi:hypothetical protein
LSRRKKATQAQDQTFVTDEQPEQTETVSAENTQETAQSAAPEGPFFCFATGCPGYSYRADVTAHPTSTCGSIVNCVHLNKDTTIAGLPETKAANSETIAAVPETEPPEIEPPTATQSELEAPELQRESQDVYVFGQIADKTGSATPEPPEPQAVEEREFVHKLIESDEPTIDEKPLFIPGIGTLWTYNLEGSTFIVEVLMHVTTADPSGQVGVVSYHLADDKAQFGWIFKVEDFSNGRLLPWDGLVPRWIADQLGSIASSLLLLDRVAEPPGEPFPVVEDMPEFAPETLDPEPPPTDTFAARVDVLASELGVRPDHVQRSIESVLDLVAQVMTFQGELETSPAVAALRDRVLAELGRKKGIVGALVAALKPALASSYQQTAEEFWRTRSDKLDQWSFDLEQKVAGFYGDLRGMREDLTKFEGIARNGDEESFTEIERSVKATSKKQETQADRIFALEQWQKLVQKELGNYARSVKLQKHDPKSAAERGKEFRRRKRELEAEQAKNKALLRKQKEDAEAIEAGKKPKGRPGRPTKAEAERRKREAARLAKKASRTPKGKRKLLTDMAARNAAAAQPEAKKAPPKAPTRGGTTFEIEQYMGKDKDDRVKKLLLKVPPSKLGKFVEQSKHGYPDVTVTGWNGTEMGLFAKWFYGRPIRR